MKKIAKIFLSIILFLLLISCFSPKKLYTNSLNEWKSEYIYNARDGSQNISISNFSKIPYVYIWLDDLGFREEKSNCEDVFYLLFKVIPEKKEKVIKYLENNQLTFNTAKFYIIKNKKKYRIKLNILNQQEQTLINDGKLLKDPLYSDYWNSIDKGKYDYNMDISKMLLAKLDKGILSNLISIGSKFVSPIGCQALEGTTLVIGGIYLNGEELPPIEIKLSYKKDKK